MAEARMRDHFLMRAGDGPPSLNMACGPKLERPSRNRMPIA